MYRTACRTVSEAEVQSTRTRSVLRELPWDQIAQCLIKPVGEAGLIPEGEGKPSPLLQSKLLEDKTLG